MADAGIIGERRRAVLTENRGEPTPTWTLGHDFATIFNTAPEAYVRLNSEFRYTFVNRAAETLLDKDRVDLLGKVLWGVYPELVGTHFDGHYRRAMAARVSVTFEDYYERRQRWYAITAAPDSDSGIVVRTVDITARRRAEEALQQSEAQFRDLFDSAPVAYHELDRDGVIRRVNRAACALLGYEAGDMLARPEWEFVSEADQAASREAFRRKLSGTQPLEPVQRRYVRRDGGELWLQIYDILVRNASGEITGIRSALLDITERKGTESYREMDREVLQILNEPGDLQGAIQRILTVLNTLTRCDAIGIRLQDGDNFPYFAQAGFPEGFLLTENTLIERGEDGGVCRDKDGKVRLECTCGLVVSGRTDPANPLFTRGGSCWTNDSSDLLNLPPGEDPRIQPRNKCIHQGYASVALIPIRDQHRIVGLIQFNDRRKGRFTLDTVALLEGIASHIGEALVRKGAEEALRASEVKYRQLFEHSVSAIAVHKIVLDAAGRPVDYVFLSANPAFEAQTGLRLADILGRRATEVLPGIGKTPLIEIYGKVALTGETVSFEHYFEALARHFFIIAYKVGEGHFAVVFTDISERKRAEQVRAQELSRLRKITSQVPGLVYQYGLRADGSTYMPFASEAIHELFRVSPEEVREDASVVFGSIHPDDRATCLASIERSARDLSPWLHEFRVMSDDGAVRWLLGNALPQREGDCSTLWHGFITDITGRKKDETELKSSREQYALAADGCSEGIWDWDIRNDTHYRSPRWKEMIGCQNDEFPGTSAAFEERIHPEDKDRVIGDFNRYLRGEIPIYCVEYRFRHKDGSYVWVMARGAVLRDKHGTPYRMAGSHTDITERKRADVRLAEAADRLTLATRAGGVGIWDYDVPNGRLVWDDQMLRLYGITGNQFCGAYNAWRQALHPDDRQRGDEEIQLALRGIREFDTEFCVVWPDGTIRSIRALALVQRDAAGQPLHMIGTNWDITLQKRAADELRNSNCRLAEAVTRANTMAVQAEAASIAKSEFLANMSHEIRTPMNGVIGMTGLLLDTELNEEQRRCAGMVRATGELLMGIINDILDFSKIEAKKLDLETLDFDLQSLLDDFAATLAVRAHAKGLELFCSADPAVRTRLRGDPGRLRQILSNLAGKAVKFTHKGEVAVRVSLAEKGTAECLLRFSVRDTGIGIPEDKIGILFEKFSQVDASVTRTYGGTGLGLAISKQLAGLMGGEVGVRSEVGVGSEFWFTVRLGRQCEGDEALSRPPAVLRGVRALIVDDSATSREILSACMTSWGMRCLEAGDGPAALQAFYRALGENDPFQVAVIDMQMPGMDGATLGRTIKADSRLAETRMVALTCLSARGDARRFDDIGFATHTTKPIQPRNVMGILSLAVTRQSGVAFTPQPVAERQRDTARRMLNLFAGRKARILIVEDNITNQLVTLGILKKFGLRADAVADGAEAIKTLESIPYDLVLMDVQMPVMDGLEATRQIRDVKSAVRDHDVPIVAMTAHAMTGDRLRFLDSGMNDYVSKPVSQRTLTDVLMRWLPKKSGEMSMETAADTTASVVDTLLPIVIGGAGV